MEDFKSVSEKEKRNVIILVEGTSDLAFLNLYLCKKYKLKYKSTLDIKLINQVP